MAIKKLFKFMFMCLIMDKDTIKRAEYKINPG